ncbi:MAG: nitrate- and nitrite sensing domain-containing protein, partial [Venatoribacter sp.]
MRIRTLFIGFSVTLVLLSGAMGVWQVLDSRNKILAVQWVQSTNQLQDSVLKVSIQLAMERGLTAGLLAKSHTAKAPTPQINDLRIAIAAQRLSTNAAFALIQQELEALAQIVPAHPVALYQRKQKELYLRFISLRQRVDQEPTNYPVQEWIASSTEIIEALQEVANISKTPVAGNIYSHSTQSLAKFLLSNLAEHLGRERALVVANLAQESQFSPQQMATLVSLRALTDYSLVRIVDFLKSQPESLNLQKNYQLLVDNYQQQQQVIQQLLDESAQQQGEIHYSIDMESWFAQATTSIQYVENMLAEISKQHDEQIGQLHHQASLTSALQLT